MRFRRRREREIDPYKRGIFEPKRYYELLRKAVTEGDAPSWKSRAEAISRACLRNIHDACNGYTETVFPGEEATDCECLCHYDEV